MFKSKQSAIELFKIQENYTSATLERFSDSALNKSPVDGFRSVVELAVHCIFVRESSLASILGDDSMIHDLKLRYPDGESVKALTVEGILESHKSSFGTFYIGLERIDWNHLDIPFRTHFGNSSCARNYLTLILQEEIHHRGQMILISRLSGLIPPDAPYAEIAALGVEQG